MRGYVNMAARWTAEEHNTLIGMLVDGVSIQSIVDAIPSKSEGAIVTRARNKKFGLDFRTSRKDGRLYQGVKRRNHNNEEKQSDYAVNILGTSRVAPTTPEVKSERTNQNLSDDIVAESTANSAKEQIFELYSTLERIVNSDNFPDLRSVSVVLSNSTFTISKDLS